MYLIFFISKPIHYLISHLLSGNVSVSSRHPIGNMHIEESACTPSSLLRDNLKRVCGKITHARCSAHP